MPTVERQLRAGSTAENAVFTGAAAELIADVEAFQLVLHDGVTVGGHRIIQANVDAVFDAGVSFTMASGFIIDAAGNLTVPGTGEFTDNVSVVAAAPIAIGDLTRKDYVDDANGLQDTAIGDNATAIGVNAGAIAANTILIGDNATAIGVNAAAIGVNEAAIIVNAGNITTLQTYSPTPDEKAAMTAASAPTGANAFATMADIADPSIPTFHTTTNSFVLPANVIRYMVSATATASNDNVLTLSDGTNSSSSGADGNSGGACCAVLYGEGTATLTATAWFGTPTLYIMYWTS